MYIVHAHIVHAIYYVKVEVYPRRIQNTLSIHSIEWLVYSILYIVSIVSSIRKKYKKYKNKNK